MKVVIQKVSLTYWLDKKMVVGHWITPGGHIFRHGDGLVVGAVNSLTNEVKLDSHETLDQIKGWIYAYEEYAGIEITVCIKGEI